MLKQSSTPNSCPPYEGRPLPRFGEASRRSKFFVFGVVLTFLVIPFSIFLACSARKSKPTQLRIHPTNWVSEHPNFIFANNLQPEYGQACKSCHGEDYSGGTVGVSCVGCHNQRRDSTLRLIVCTGCHGGGVNPIDSTLDSTGAPPYSLTGDSLFSDRGVGGHQAMVNGKQFFTGTDCQTCHSKPAFVFSSSHFSTATRFSFDTLGQLQVFPGDGRAEVVFSGLARTFASFYGEPVFDTTFGGLCSNVYCHGAFPGGNRTHLRSFLRDSGQVNCGSCHAVSSNYVSLSGRHRTHNPDSLGISCPSCHFATVDTSTDTLIQFINGRPSPTHVNGIFDVDFDLSVAPNAVFNPAARSCSGISGAPCHTTTPADTLWDN